MATLPDIGALVAPLLARVPQERRPLLVAAAERLAAARYREWAEARPDARPALLACAAREEEIADRVEALFAGTDPDWQAPGVELPDLERLYRELFAGLGLAAQWTVQARGERLGAATWRSLAARSEPAARATFEACAALEEESAETLERLLEAM